MQLSEYLVLSEMRFPTTQWRASTPPLFLARTKKHVYGCQPVAADKKGPLMKGTLSKATVIKVTFQKASLN